MASGGRYTGYGFQSRHLHQSQPVLQIDPRFVVRNDEFTSQNSRPVLPGHNGFPPAFKEIRSPLPVALGIGRIQLRHSPSQGLRNDEYIVRIDLYMRVALWMHIALGPINTGRHIQARHEAAGLEVANIARSHVRIVGLAQQLGQPADFKFSSRTNQQVGLAKLGDQAGTRLDVVGILQGMGGAVSFDQVAAYFHRQGFPFRFTGEHQQVRLHQRRRDQEDRQVNTSMHEASPKNCAHRVRRC